MSRVTALRPVHFLLRMEFGVLPDRFRARQLCLLRASGLLSYCSHPPVFHTLEIRTHDKLSLNSRKIGGDADFKPRRRQMGG